MEEIEEEKKDGIGSWITNADGATVKRVLLWVEIVFFIFVYICSRYDYQRKEIRLENLKKELVDLEYQSLNVTSSVSAKSKPSYIETVVSQKESSLSSDSESPFILP